MSPSQVDMSTRSSDRTGALGFAGLAALSAVFPLLNFDIWWHLATGRHILNGGGIPRTDPFSFTAGDVPWIDHEWLFQCLAHGLYLFGGTPALIALRIGVVTVVALLVYFAVLRTRLLPAPAVALLLVPFLMTARARFLVRPGLISLLFVVLLLVVLFRRRATPPGWRELAWIPPLFALWANLHAALIVGLLVLAAVAAGRTLGAMLARRHAGADPTSDGLASPAICWGLLAVSMLAALANPYGWRIYRVPFDLAAINASGVVQALEAKPPTFGAHPLFFVVAGLTLLLALGAVARRRLATDWAALFVLLLFTALALRYARNVAFFGFAAPILLAQLWSPSGSSTTTAPALPRLDRWLHPLATTAGLWLLGTSLAVSGGGFGINATLPVAGTDFLDEHRPPGHLFNYPDAFGSYLTWRLAPEVPVFLDGRNDVFFEVWKEFDQASQRQADWREFLERYDMGQALVGYLGVLQPVTLMDLGSGQPRTVHRPWAANHFPRREWALVHWDDHSMVYVRRREENAELLERFEDRHLYPEDPGYQLEMISQGRASREGAIADLERRLLTDPTNQRAQQLLAVVAQMPEGTRSRPPTAPRRTPGG